ncbi:unnamed protein product [Ostreobium quekettii]|uniref:Glucosamine 6-phosphate N-acetyltransferase n=1 Tax=Ostreobium quekettii TaxID=121088 RepID=A0A8S1J225_9CHLO|nr:unnamed protein product [Ostreobium quekettii]|eukprot:evm.model.scf_876.9 EVM.evm.TU.scf_876.9   scf_876:48372-48809(+)
MAIRELEESDYGKGFLGILSQLTTLGEVPEDVFVERFRELRGSPDYRVLVAEEPERGRVVGAATLFVERKFIHACGKVGHVEDVVVDVGCRGHGVGQRLVAALLEAAREAGCYKAILDCAEQNQGFYEKCGMVRKEVQMVKYFDR